MKKVYRIKNWSEYNKSLIQRGSLTFWFSEDAINNWHSVEHTEKKGRPCLYSDDAILCALLVRGVYHLPLRMLVGFLFSLIKLMGLPLKIPSYTQICRRAKSLDKKLDRLSKRRPKDIVFDSTGLKVYGEGEWKVRQHGKTKRRTWRKLHIGLDPKSQEIILSELTLNNESDAEVGCQFLDKLPQGVKTVLGDGAYDRFKFREKIQNKGALPLIPPPRNAALHQTVEGYIKERDQAILEIAGLGGDEIARKIWKKLKGYHRRSLVETAMYRIKQITGERLRSRELGRQRVEGRIKCLIINKMTRLGMPIGQWEWKTAA